MFVRRIVSVLAGLVLFVQGSLVRAETGAPSYDLSSTDRSVVAGHPETEAAAINVGGSRTRYGRAIP